MGRRQCSNIYAWRFVVGWQLVGDVSNVAVAALNRAGLHKAQARFAARHHKETQAGQSGGQVRACRVGLLGVVRVRLPVV